MKARRVYRDHEDDAYDVTLVSGLRIIQEMPVNMKHGEHDGADGAWEGYEDEKNRRHRRRRRDNGVAREQYA